MNKKNKNLMSENLEFIIRLPESQLEEILVQLQNKSFEETNPNNRIKFGEEYLTKMIYVGNKKYEEIIKILESENITYETNTKIYSSNR